jgi:hypothetical protein
MLAQPERTSKTTATNAAWKTEEPTPLSPLVKGVEVDSSPEKGRQGGVSRDDE